MLGRHFLQANRVQPIGHPARVLLGVRSMPQREFQFQCKTNIRPGLGGARPMSEACQDPVGLFALTVFLLLVVAGGSFAIGALWEKTYHT